MLYILQKGILFTLYAVKQTVDLCKRYVVRSFPIFIYTLSSMILGPWNVENRNIIHFSNRQDSGALLARTTSSA
jgi:hypothetical protein